MSIFALSDWIFVSISSLIEGFHNVLWCLSSGIRKFLCIPWFVSHSLTYFLLPLFPLFLFLSFLFVLNVCLMPRLLIVFAVVSNFCYVEHLSNSVQLIPVIPDLSSLVFKYLSNKAKKNHHKSNQGNELNIWVPTWVFWHVYFLFFFWAELN